MQAIYHNGQLPVAVYRSQLRTMESDTLDPIHWPLPPTIYRAVPPDRHFVQIKSVVRGIDAGPFGTLGHRFASDAISE